MPRDFLTSLADRTPFTEQIHSHGILAQRKTSGCARAKSQKCLALAGWSAARGGIQRIGGGVLRVIPSRASTSSGHPIKRHARWIPIVAVWRHTVRATDGLQTTITCGPVNRIDQTVSLELSLHMSLPMPHQDEH